MKKKPLKKKDVKVRTFKQRLLPIVVLFVLFLILIVVNIVKNKMQTYSLNYPTCTLNPVPVNKEPENISQFQNRYKIGNYSLNVPTEIIVEEEHYTLYRTFSNVCLLVSHTNADYQTQLSNIIHSLNGGTVGSLVAEETGDGYIASYKTDYYAGSIKGKSLQYVIGYHIILPDGELNVCALSTEGDNNLFIDMKSMVDDICATVAAGSQEKEESTPSVSTNGFVRGHVTDLPVNYISGNDSSNNKLNSVDKELSALYASRIPEQYKTKNSVFFEKEIYSHYKQMRLTFLYSNLTKDMSKILLQSPDGIFHRPINPNDTDIGSIVFLVDDAYPGKWYIACEDEDLGDVYVTVEEQEHYLQEQDNLQNSDEENEAFDPNEDIPYIEEGGE